jgi:hypothetical protein
MRSYIREEYTAMQDIMHFSNAQIGHDHRSTSIVNVEW